MTKEDLALPKTSTAFPQTSETDKTLTSISSIIISNRLNRVNSTIRKFHNNHSPPESHAISPNVQKREIIKETLPCDWATYDPSQSRD